MFQTFCKRKGLGFRVQDVLYTAGFRVSCLRRFVNARV